MRLVKLHISGYKNLENVEIDFSKSNGHALIIGTNGCGKSNLLEALSAIFSALYTGSKNVKPDFRFELEYEIGSGASYPRTYPYTYGPNKIEVRNVDGVIEVKKDGKPVNKPDDIIAVLPPKTIAVYSGEEKRLWEDYYYDSYIAYNKNFGTKPQRMVFINKYYWDIIISVLYTSEITDHKNFLSKQIGINKISKIKLQFDVSKIKGNKNPIASEFLKLLNPQNQSDCEIIFEEFEKIRSIASSDNDLFFNLAVLVLYKDYKIITDFKVIYNDDKIVRNLSEGEKKLLLIYGAINLIDGDENLILFDEPDAHLHEGRKKEIYDLIMASTSRQIVVASHSPKLIKLFPNNCEFMLRINEGHVEQISNADYQVLNEILDSEISFEEENAIKESRKPLLLVEGKTDKKHLENAWGILYGDTEMPYTIINMTCADKIKAFINSVPDSFAKQKIIGLVDNDDAGLKVICNADKIEPNIYKHKNDENQARQAYTLVIPFINPDVANFKYCPIEFLYSYDILNKYNVIEQRDYKESMHFWISAGKEGLKKQEYQAATEICFYKIKDCEKNNFAESVIRDGIVEPELEQFKMIFEMINKIMSY